MSEMKKRTPDWITIGRYVMVLIFVLYIVFLFMRDKESTVPFGEVEKAVAAAADMGKLKEAGYEDVRKFYRLNPKEYEGTALYMAKDAMQTEEILYIRVKDKEQMQEVRVRVEERLSSQKNNFDGYGAEQTKLLKDAVMDVKGKDLLFIVSPKGHEIKKAYEKAL